MSDARGRLFDIIKSRSVLTGGDFKLASGGQSSVFFDMKMTLLTPEGLDLASRLFLDLVDGEPVDAVAGLVLGAGDAAPVGAVHLGHAEDAPREPELQLARHLAVADGDRRCPLLW